MKSNSRTEINKHLKYNYSDSLLVRKIALIKNRLLFKQYPFVFVDWLFFFPKRFTVVSGIP